MRERRRFPRISLLGLVFLVGCGGLDEDEASLQIREQLCSEWPYGCTDSTRIDVKKVRKTSEGRRVEFRIVDRQDATPMLSAAYFEPSEDDGWDLLLFESPFRQALDQRVNRFSDDRRLFTDQLMELKAAQKWFISIYGRYATSLEELDSVSYKPPEAPLTMAVEVGGSAWSAQVASSFVSCELDSAGQLPDCPAQVAEGAGKEDGPLARAFGEE